MSVNFDFPSNNPIANADGMATQSWIALFTRWHALILDGASSGTTAERPTKNLYVGKFYYDETLNKPIWFRALPNVWRDAAGVIV